MSKALIIFGMVMSLLFSYNIIYEIDNTNYVNLVNEVEQGLQSATKAALLQLENTQNNNLKSIGQGYLEQVPNDLTAINFNNYIKLDINKAIDTFFNTYYCFFKNNDMYERSNYLLEKSTTIAIIEPVRLTQGGITDTVYRLYIYKFSISENKMLIESINDYQSTIAVETAINDTLSKMIIKLNDTGTTIVDLEKKTYFIAITEDLELPLYNLQTEQQFVTAFYFEGSNLERNKTFRGEEK